MRSILRISLGIGALFALQATAQAQMAWHKSEFQLTPRAGLGDLRVDRFVPVHSDEPTKETHGLGIGFGFLTPVGIVVEAGGDYFGNDNLFGLDDNITLRQEFISVGYQFELGDGWRLVPRVGRAHWKIRSDDDQFFDDNDPAVIHRGNDYFWEASVGRQISRKVTLGLNVKQGNYDFGRTRSAAFVVTIGF
jgi:hypothetical protein